MTEPLDLTEHHRHDYVLTQPAQYTDCQTCARAVTTTLVSACASVGMEHGVDTDQAVRRHLAGYHARGHRTARRARQHQ